ncbi:ribonuclease Y [Spiroplasma apis]|uniref:Ribonuclease Y n=1 Tax=Spiroplasma apis B31 TaxID=1276258 RepID=V5RJ79_SPIAP|nr:ribonuclease Y [Spiroplasma apis]AHB36161.1 hypothetical protein SAPIS_v1c03150 [Spiroplasma apis B31]
MKFTWENDTFIVIITVFVVLSVLLTTALIYILFSRKYKNVLKKAQSDAKKLKMTAMADTKVEIAAMKAKAEEEIDLKKEELESLEKDYIKKKKLLFEQLEEVADKEEKLVQSQIEVKKMKSKLSTEIDQVVSILEITSEMNVEEAKEKLILYTEKTYIEDLAKELKIKEEKLLINSKQRANEILIDAMQKCSVQVATEKNTTIFKIEDDNLKGKIIGREGRNVKTFQQYGGVDIVIDEVPNRILISSFNPIRREIAYKALEALMKSGKIQPVAIEEQLILQEQKLEETFEQTGYEIMELFKINNLDIEVIKSLGKLKFRYSYGQNVLQHSIEVATFSKLIAAELELDEDIALLAGLLHDIGKAIDFEKEGSHISLGAQLLRKVKMDEIIVNAVEAHHGDVEKKSFYAEIVAIADTLSAARTGARNNNSEEYMHRMREIEETCLSFEGVSKAYVLQAGRQIRVIVNPNLVDDYELKKLVYKIKDKISSINRTPGEIVITLIREIRQSLKV